MHDFYRHSQPMPLDQADGLRRMFAGRRTVVMPLVANPYVGFSGVVLDRLSTVLAGQGRTVLVVDAAGSSPRAHELAAVDLAAGIERIAPRVGYLPAGGLPRAYIDTRGSAAGFVDALLRAAPQADTVLLHADAQDLARMFKRRTARPVLLGADHPDSIKHAYAGAKLLAQRCALMSFDLALAAAPNSPRAANIAQSLASCAEQFFGAVLCHAALVDPAGDVAAPADSTLQALLAAQLNLEDADMAFATPNTPRTATIGAHPAF